MVNWKKRFLNLISIISALAGFLVLVNYIGWFYSDPVAELVTIDPTISIPDWANAYHFDHGKYIFYEDSPSQNPYKIWKILSFIFFSWIVLPSYLSHLSKKYYKED